MPLLCIKHFSCIPLIPFPNKLLFLLVCSRVYTSFENTVGIGKNARNDQFLLFSAVFFTLLETPLPSVSDSKLSSANSCNLELSKICCLGKDSHNNNCLSLTKLVLKMPLNSFQFDYVKVKSPSLNSDHHFAGYSDFSGDASIQCPFICCLGH